MKKPDLLKAIRLGDKAEALMLANSQHQTKDRDGRGAVTTAVLTKDPQLLIAIIEGGHNINETDKGGETPLHFAARFHLVEIAEILIKHGASIDVQDAYGNTPLWRATFEAKGRVELIKLLLANGADPNLENYSSVSPKRIAPTTLPEIFQM
jgi:uncharacterized protein